MPKTTPDTPMVYDFDDETRAAVYRPMNEEELRQREIDAAASVAEHRVTKQREIVWALDASDRRLLRAMEDDDAKRVKAVKAYRTKLRALYAKAATSDDALSLTVPDPPA